MDTVVLAVLTRREDAWLIKAFENVTLTNPRTGESVLGPWKLASLEVSQK